MGEKGEASGGGGGGKWGERGREVGEEGEGSGGKGGGNWEWGTPLSTHHNGSNKQTINSNNRLPN